MKADVKVAILGFGVEGQAAYRYYRGSGIVGWGSGETEANNPDPNYDLRSPNPEITICDANSDLEVPAGVHARLGAGYLTKLESFDVIVRSPGVRPSDIEAANPGIDLSSQLTAVTRLFFDQCPAPIIGVTGTKGKGTTATLISKILEVATKTVWLGGNIGRPALDFLDQVQPTDYVVLELSSFQLIDVTTSPQIGVILMIAPDHLNWHKDMDEYVQAKGNLVRYQTVSQMVIYNAENRYSTDLAQLSKGVKVPYLVKSQKSKVKSREGAYVEGEQIWMGETLICQTGDVRLLGRHNLENVCAAVAATWEIVQDAVPIRQAIQAFTGLPHRLELAGEIKGARYINDSFAVVPDAAMAALRSFAEPKVVIMGGSDKGADFNQLATAVKANHVKQAIVIGEVAPKITAALESVGFTNYVTGLRDMPAIARAAAEAAQAGDVVLLSPGCASFGLFRDYKDRGEQFKAAVTALAGQK